MQRSKMAAWGGLTNNCEKKSSKNQRRKGKIIKILKYEFKMNFTLQFACQNSERDGKNTQKNYTKRIFTTQVITMV